MSDILDAKTEEPRYDTVRVSSEFVRPPLQPPIAQTVSSPGSATDRRRERHSALHGRGANCGRMLREVRAIVSDREDIAIVVLQAPANRWYTKAYSVSVADHGEELDEAFTRVTTELDALTAVVAPETLFVFGFSQGACLAIESLARRGGPLGGVVAICGARIGERETLPPSKDISGVPIVLGAAESDKWLDVADIRATARQVTAAGGRVEIEIGPGSEHEISDIQRDQVRRVLLGREVADGEPT